MKKILSWIFGPKTHRLPKNFKKQIDPEALDILQRLQRAGFESYLVGGCVRDLFLQDKPKDFDIATRATPQQVKAVVKRSFIIGKRFRIVVAKRPFHKASNPEVDSLFPPLLKRVQEKEYQITTFRRAPVEVQGQINENVFGNPDEDATRRDFTINGLFLNPFSGEIVDYVGGLEDLQNRKLRMIGDPLERFQEDPVRILRALRFLHRANLKWDRPTQQALEKALPSLEFAKKERVREEILKIFREGQSAAVLKDFHKHNVWKYLNTFFAEALQQYGPYENYLEKLGKVLAEEPWRDSQNPAPLFFLIFAPMLLGKHRVSGPFLNEIQDTFKVSKKEREDIMRIQIFLNRLAREDKTDQLLRRYLAPNPRFAPHQIQCFYVLKILGELKEGPFTQLWSQAEEAYKQHLPFIKNLKESNYSSDSARSSSRRRGRRSRPPSASGERSSGSTGSGSTPPTSS